MTVDSNTIESVQSIPSGAEAGDEFSFTFKVLDADHIHVYHTPTGEAEVELAEGTNFTVALDDAGLETEGDDGGTVTLVTDLTPGSIRILRTVDTLQTEYDPSTGGPFVASQIERAMDKTAMVLQQQQAEIDDLSNGIEVADGSITLEKLDPGLSPLLEGLKPRASVRVATTTGLPYLFGLLTIDGITVSDGDRVLVKDGVDGADNGNAVFIARQTSNWEREESTLESRTAWFVTEGTANTGTTWFVTNDDPITLGVVQPDGLVLGGDDIEISQWINRAPLDGSVTNAKLAPMATGRIKGRVAAGSGAPADLTGEQVTNLLSSFTGTNGATGGAQGVVPAPAAAAYWKLLAGQGTWQYVNGHFLEPELAGSLDFRLGEKMMSDFFSLGEGGFNSYTLGTAAAATIGGTPPSGWNGVAALVAGTDTNGRAAVKAGDKSVLPVGTWRFDAKVRLSHLSGGAGDHFFAMVGLSEAAMSEAGNGLKIDLEYTDDAESGRWVLWIRSGVTYQAFADTGVTVAANTDYAITLIGTVAVNGNGTVTAYINGSQVAEITTSGGFNELPSVEAARVTPLAGIRKVGGTAGTATMYVDYINWQHAYLNERSHDPYPVTTPPGAPG